MDNTIKRLNINPKKRNAWTIFTVYFRLLVAIIYTFSTCPFLWLFTILRLTHPFFRSLGVPNHLLPCDLVNRIWSYGLMKVVDIEVVVENAQDVPKNKTLAIMYSHASSIDPFILVGFSPVSAKFIFKKSLLYSVPYLFIPAVIYGHIPIDRTNREEAIETLRKTGVMIAKDKRIVCIAPEGTRSLTGKLQEFKKGPFHLALGGNVPIVPVVLFNNFEVWPPKHISPYSGKVIVRFLPVVTPTKEDTPESLSEKVHAIMLKELEFNRPIVPAQEETILNSSIFMAIFLSITYYLYNYWF